VTASAGPKRAHEIISRWITVAAQLREIGAEGTLVIAGMDRETIGSLGGDPTASAYTVVEPIDTPSGVLRAVDTARIGGGLPLQLIVKSPPRAPTAEEIETVRATGRRIIPLAGRL
jgi:hypothetical protein